MKSNPYVYPFVPFHDLSDYNMCARFSVGKTVSHDVIKKILSTTSLVAKWSGDSPEERIVSFFLDDEVRFGRRTLIEELRSYWLEKIRFFVKSKRRLEFTLLGFPFKAPMPLKTSRTLPDLGEVLILRRLQQIIETLQEIYPEGARITVFTEGAFAPLVGIKKTDADEYADRLDRLNELFGSVSVVFRRLSDMEKMVPEFNSVWREKALSLEKLYQKKDPKMIHAYRGAYESVYRIVSTRTQSESALLRVYDDTLKDEDASPKTLEIRGYLREKTHEAVFYYLAYLQLRDDLGFLEKTATNALALSVSPKPYRLGILPINKQCVRLPYHAVTVMNTRKNRLSLEYLIDLKRMDAVVVPVFLEGDKDPEPFYYEATNRDDRLQ